MTSNATFFSLIQGYPSSPVLSTSQSLIPKESSISKDRAQGPLLAWKKMQELCLCKGLALVSYWLLLGLAKHLIPLHLYNCEWGLQQQHRASAATFTVFFMAAQATAFDTCPFPK